MAWSRRRASKRRSWNSSRRAWRSPGKSSKVRSAVGAGPAPGTAFQAALVSDLVRARPIRTGGLRGRLVPGGGRAAARPRPRPDGVLAER